MEPNPHKHLITKSDGDDTLENMRIASLEKDSENVDDDDAVQVMRINEHGEAVEIMPGEEDDDADDDSLILVQEKPGGSGITLLELKDAEGSING